jgi:hypothetical protein
MLLLESTDHPAAMMAFQLRFQPSRSSTFGVTIADYQQILHLLQEWQHLIPFSFRNISNKVNITF